MKYVKYVQYVLTIMCGVALSIGCSSDVQAQVNSNDIAKFTEVYNSGISGADNASNPNGVKNLIRSWALVSGFDLDNDGNNEIAVFDASDHVYFVYESKPPRGVNNGYETVFAVPAPSPLVGGERGIMITDMDHDGNKELVIVWDSFHPDSAGGFPALWVYEHVPGSGEFLPSEPQLKYDPPRNTAGQVRLETQNFAGDFDFDGNIELVLTYRGQKDMLLAVLQFTGSDIAGGTFTVEFTDDGSPSGFGGTTPEDSTAFKNRVHGLAKGDLNGDGRPDFVMFPDTDPVEVRIYTTTGPDAWTMTLFDDTVLPADYVTAKGSNTTPGIGDFNMDGYPEVYIIARGKTSEDPTTIPKLLVVTPAGGGFFDLATAFNAENFHDLGVSAIVKQPLSDNKNDLRGGFVGDGDNDGNLEIYICSRDFNTVFATEWAGEPGGDVTDGFNYQTTAIVNTKDAFPNENIQLVTAVLADLDGDGPNHLDLVLTSPNGEHQGNAPSLYVLEYDANDAEVPDLPINSFTEVYNSGISGADNASNPNGVKNLIRSWALVSGFDLDNDGNNEIAVFDASDHVYFVYESKPPRGVNNGYETVFAVPAPSPLVGGERGIMITDMDHDGNKELVIVWDSFHPDSAGGFPALWVYEHVPGSGEFLPSEPQLKYDPPRNTAGQVRLETQNFAGDFDFDGNIELVLTYRGQKDMLLAVLQFTGSDIAGGTFTVEFTDDGSPSGFGGTTPEDSTAFKNRVHGLAKGDLNGDGRPDFVMFPDTDPVEVRIYTTTGPDAWTMTLFDDTVLPADYVTAKGSNTTPGIGDFNMDGYPEVYIIARGKTSEDPTTIPKLLVVTPAGGGFFDLATAFNAENFHDLGVSAIVKQPLSDNKNDLRGGFVGDGDNDGNLEIYICSRDFNTVFATEWAGEPGGDVTDGFNYQTTAIVNTKDAFPNENIQLVTAVLADLDGDGPNHLDLVVTSPNGEHQGNAPSLFVLEFNASNVGVSVAFDTPNLIPENYALRQNYPNPFNPTTHIVYELPVGARVKLEVFNMLGQKVRTLVKEDQAIGLHQIQWDGKDDLGLKVGSGIYIYRLDAGTFSASRKMLLLK